MAETVDHLFRKFLAKNIHEALSCIPNKGDVSKEKIKVARKAIKRVRTILRLLSSSLKSGWVKTEEEILKDISREFKILRNIFIAEEVFKEVIPLLKQEIAKCDTNEVLALFDSLEKEALASFQQDEKKRKSIIVDLQVAYERLDEMLFKASPWDPILNEVEDTYRVCAKLYKAVSKKSTDAELIDFRKSLNFLNIEISFLAPYLQSQSKEHLKSVEALSHHSGHVQDTILILQLLKDNKKKFTSIENLKEILAFLEEYKNKSVNLLKDMGKEPFKYAAKDYPNTIFDMEKVKAEKEKFKAKKSTLF